MDTTVINKFGRLSDLANEATVETFFVSRLLRDLGYNDSQIKPKSSLDELVISLGRRKVRYRPDYAITLDGRVRWICEVKGVDEDLDKWTGQSASYCLELNRSSDEDNPVEYFMLTNGVITRVYRWDLGEPLFEAQFHQFVDGNEGYDRIRELLSPEAMRRPRTAIDTPSLKLHKRTVSELNADFAWAHKFIYKRENLSYTAAFMEFVKLIFLKLISDRQVHGSPLASYENGEVTIPAAEVRFSRKWIEDREGDTQNPLDAILFQRLLDEFETEIQAGTKKRIFNHRERLNLSADTIKAIVERFQGVDLISIDADLNGRMFETFLNSTLRGKALGQYFTPRSVVKLATALARLNATPGKIDRVIDACCGTGGFLIEALAVMTAQVNSNQSLSNSEKENLRTRVATRSLFGIDVARDPALVRIARINMYLHGDGGSSIYQLDALDKKMRKLSTDDAEIRREKTELSSTLADAGSAGFHTVDGTRRPAQSLSSNVMFLERYHDLLKPGGRLITVIDDSILGSRTYRGLRKWIRENWLVRAVVSLPGDAFQRSQARVKTSVIVLEKRANATQEQPSIFMYYCTDVGVDDAPRQRVLPIDELNREKAIREIAKVSALFDAFYNGRAEANPWTVPPEAIIDRMDVKACLTHPGRRVSEWHQAGLKVVRLEDLIELIGSSDEEPDRYIDVENTEDDEMVSYLRVRYDGFTESGDSAWISEVKGRFLMKVKENDIVFSHINALHGAVGVVPADHAGHVVTNEYTVCRAKEGVDPLVVWSLVRTPEARADLLLLATGIGRTRIQWEQAKNLQIPRPTSELSASIKSVLSDADQAEKRALELRGDIRAEVEEELLLNSEVAQSIISAFKPPR